MCAALPVFAQTSPMTPDITGKGWTQPAPARDFIKRVEMDAAR